MVTDAGRAQTAAARAAKLAKREAKTGGGEQRGARGHFPDIDQSVSDVIQKSGPIGATDIAETLGCTAPTVYKAIKRLKQNRKIRVHSHGTLNGAGKNPALYVTLIRGRAPALIRGARRAPGENAPETQLSPENLERGLERANAINRIRSNTSGSAFAVVLDELNELTTQKREFENQIHELEDRIRETTERQRQIVQKLAIAEVAKMPRLTAITAGPSQNPKSNGHASDAINAELLDEDGYKMQANGLPS